MSGSTPKVLGLTTGTSGVALLPNTSGSRTLLIVALAAFGIGLVTLAISAAISYKQRLGKA
jgi:hypothetical protein